MQINTDISIATKQLMLTKRLTELDLNAYYVPAEDEHLNEYAAPHKKRIDWLTGFTGEAAPAFITRDKIYLFVDGRFHEQVDMEVDAKAVHIYKLGKPEALRPSEKLRRLAQKHEASYVVGFDPFTMTHDNLKALQKSNPPNLQWKAIQGNLIDNAWENPPAASEHPAFRLDKDVHGMDTTEKLAMLRELMESQSIGLIPVTRLDEIAWLLNIRGSDIPYNPVVESYMLLTATEAMLFIRPEAVPKNLAESLQQDGISMYSYSEYIGQSKRLAQALSSENKVWIDPSGMTLGSQSLFENCKQHHGRHPITDLKAIKNQTEAHWMAEANKQASIALITHFAWAKQAFEAGGTLSEVDLREHIEATYKSRPGFHELSFPTIPGLGSNSAIIHYCEADPKQKASDGCWYLLDSGAHYMGGTTDTTRTNVFGTPTQAQIDCYTAVLKAHIACAKQIFPEGTTGTQLDAITRAPLWQQGLNFTHGTGHGVGAFLNVHEGPNRISPACNIPFELGMVTSDEPGYYVPGWGGIRLENLYIVEEASHYPDFMGKAWYQFRSLTLVPFENKLIKWSAMTQDEITWLTDYYDRILTECSEHCEASALRWLEAQCEIPEA